MRPSETRLLDLLSAIFADNVVTADERDSLLELQSELPADSVQRVFAAFVELKWGEALEDGVVTDEEKLVLQRVAEELELPDTALPARMRFVMRLKQE